MLNEKVLGLVGNEVIKDSELQFAALGLKGLSDELAANAVLDTKIGDKTGIFIVSDETNEDSVIISLHNDGGTATPTIVNGSANFAIAKDTASKVNVYVEDGTLQIQNKLAGSANVKIKAYK